MGSLSGQRHAPWLAWPSLHGGAPVSRVLYIGHCAFTCENLEVLCLSVSLSAPVGCTFSSLLLLGLTFLICIWPYLSMPYFAIFFFYPYHGVLDPLFTPYLLLTLLLPSLLYGQIWSLPVVWLSFNSEFVPSLWTAPPEYPDSTSGSSCSKAPSTTQPQISSSSHVSVSVKGTTIHSLT